MRNVIARRRKLNPPKMNVDKDKDEPQLSQF